MANPTYDPNAPPPNVIEPPSPETGKPNQVDAAPSTPDDKEKPQDDQAGYIPDREYLERCLSDAERAEKDWRSEARTVIQIYRNSGSFTLQGKKKANSEIVFNILYSNTEVMLPAIYSKAPEPVVRSRFVKKSTPPAPLPLPPMANGIPPMPGGPLPPDGLNSSGPMPPPLGADAAGAPTLPSGGAPPLPPVSPGPQAPAMLSSMEEPVGGAPPPPFAPPTSLPQAPNPIQPLAPPQPAPPVPGMPRQQDIDTAASVMEKALEIVLDDERSHEATKAAVKDVLLPGRGTCRVRWQPVVETHAIPLDGPTGGALPSLDAPDQPATEDIKVWETVFDEYVYWEDMLYDPTRQFADGDWLAFRHLFDKKSLLAQFNDSEELQKLNSSNKLDELLKWTEEGAAKSPVGGGAPMKTADKLGDVIKKAMVWEFWDRSNRKIVWFVRELTGIVLRVDEDTLQLSAFFPVPKPLLAVTTTDTQIPRPYYSLYKDLAGDIDETSKRISNLTEKIKVRGAYNAATKEIIDILTAGDGKLVPIPGVDLMTGGLQNHIWLVPILEWVNALKELYVAREEIKQAIYEIMGISDIMRGATNPHETATAQRIKGTMGAGRMAQQKAAVETFCRDLLRLKAEIIAKNFDQSTLTRMTGEDITEPVMQILRSDFQRTCSIDVETDSTVVIDEQMEQEGNAKIMMAMQGILQNSMAMLQTPILPAPMTLQFSLELMKMMIRPIRNSRPVIEMIDGFQEILAAQVQNPQAMMQGPPPPGGAPKPPGLPPPGPSGGPPPRLNGGPPPPLPIQ